MKLTAGIDLGGTRLKVGLVNDKGCIVARGELDTTIYRKKEDLINAMAEEVKRLLKLKRLKTYDLIGIGIGTPGIVDSVNGIVYDLTNIPGWKKVELKRLIEKRIHIPTFVDNDVNLMALGEFTYGAGKGVQSMVCLTMGTGVGGGIIIDGKLYRGATLSAGEIGHITINKDGPKCMCGGIGCLERYIGNRYIVSMALEKLKKVTKSKIMLLVNGDRSKITPKVLFQAAKQGDRVALEIWNEVGRDLGMVLAGVVNFLNPEKIIIGGGVAKAGNFLFNPVRKTVLAYAMDLPAKATAIVPAKLGNDAGIIGAATLARQSTVCDSAQ
ncbi:MAG: ROK family protein [Candidatus Omnitrophica bacterium]|nr:ROK family protein [Candidatus Omnitrophota bacterium]